MVMKSYSVHMSICESRKYVKVVNVRKSYIHGVQRENEGANEGLVLLHKYVTLV
jgi:hypothetical protein